MSDQLETVRTSSLEIAKSFSFAKGRLGRFAGVFSLAPLALVRPLTVVAVHPGVQILLQLFDAQVDFLCESNRVKLVFASAMKPLADSVGLRILRLRLRMVDVVESQEELVVVAIGPSAVLGTPVGQDPQESHALFLKEWNDPGIEQIC